MYVAGAIMVYSCASAAMLGGAGCVALAVVATRGNDIVFGDDVPVARPILFTSPSWYSWSG